MLYFIIVSLTERDDYYFCPNCGNQINDNEKFCSKCGNQIKQDSQDNNEQMKQSEKTISNNISQKCRYWKELYKI